MHLKERANNVQRFTFRSPNEDCDRHRRLGAAGQRRRHDLAAHGRRTRDARPRGSRLVGEWARHDPCPTYPEIRLALWPGKRLAAELDSFAPDAIHVATEGPLGMAAARHCTTRRLAFTTSYHTQLPQYVRKRVPIPEKLTYALLRRHHSQARRTLVATEQQRRELVANGFRNVVLWSRGVDTELFRPAAASTCRTLARSSRTWVASPSKRTSRRFSSSICREPKS